MRLLKSILILTVLICAGLFATEDVSYIQIKSESGISVFLNDEFHGVTSSDFSGLILGPLQGGTYTIKLVKIGFQPQQFDLSISSGEVLPYEVKEFIPRIRITQGGNKKQESITLRTGSLKVQSIPININIRVSAIDINSIKMEDEWMAREFPVGRYSVDFIWNNKQVNYMVNILENEMTHLFVNMIEGKVLIKEQINIDSIIVEAEAVDTTAIYSLRFNHEEDESIYVHAGYFDMGNTRKDKRGESNEKPVHEVNLTKDFFMGRYEINHEQFIQFLNDYDVSEKGTYEGYEILDMDDADCAVEFDESRGFFFKSSTYVPNATCPIVEVTWYGAVAYCNWLSICSGLKTCYEIESNGIGFDYRANGYRLPTEAEWEYAARGGDMGRLDYKFAGGNNIKKVAIYFANSNNKLFPVGMKDPNDIGLYDMSGNTSEWCWDYYESYPNARVVDPTGPTSGSYRSVRGGSWNSSPEASRISYRNYALPSDSYYNYGFRVCRNAE